MRIIALILHGTASTSNMANAQHNTLSLSKEKPAKSPSTPATKAALQLFEYQARHDKSSTPTTMSGSSTNTTEAPATVTSATAQSDQLPLDPNLNDIPTSPTPRRLSPSGGSSAPNMGPSPSGGYSAPNTFPWWGNMNAMTAMYNP
jgi:hypothetical protein